MIDNPAASPHDDGIDPTLLPALLARLGPAVAPDLKYQLGADLRSLRQALGVALGPPPDLDSIARQAHVLIALAGSAGAMPMVARSRHLLRSAHGGDVADSLRLLHPLLPRIDRLIAFVATCPLPDPPSPPT